MTLSHAETRDAIKRQDPPIEPGQRWRIAEDDGTVVLELRVVCRYFDVYPDGKAAEGNDSPYLVMERCGGTQRNEFTEQFGLSRLPEYNLRRLFEPVSHDGCRVCRHPKHEPGACDFVYPADHWTKGDPEHACRCRQPMSNQ